MKVKQEAKLNKKILRNKLQLGKRVVFGEEEEVDNFAFSRWLMQRAVLRRAGGRRAGRPRGRSTWRRRRRGWRRRTGRMRRPGGSGTGPRRRHELWPRFAEAQDHMPLQAAKLKAKQRQKAERGDPEEVWDHNLLTD